MGSHGGLTCPYHLPPCSGSLLPQVHAQVLAQLKSQAGLPPSIVREIEDMQDLVRASIQGRQQQQQEEQEEEDEGEGGHWNEQVPQPPANGHIW